MTVYLVDGSMSRKDSRRASANAVNDYTLPGYTEYQPFSASLAALLVPNGRAGKSRLTTRGFLSSTILKEPAKGVSFSTINFATPVAF